MRFFTTAQSVEISPEAVIRARGFAEAIVQTVNYSDSYQFNTEKVKRDHFISKIGEEATAAVFRQFTPEITLPDYEIYLGKQKNWNDDIYVNGIGLAVKTQPRSAAEKYGLSWTFQCGKRRSDPILGQPDAWICFVQCIDLGSTYPCIVYPPRQLKTIKFGEPKLAKLKGEKKVVYAAENGIDLYIFQ